MVRLVQPVNYSVAVGGTSTIALFGPMLGGAITNPADAADQGISVAEALYINLTGPASLKDVGATQAIQPGQSFQIPENFTGNIWVNAASSGHLFSAFAVQPDFNFVPPSGTFPPTGPTTLTQTIPSYLYKQYDDDDDLQAFVDSYNVMAQQYVDWFVSIGLPVYTGTQISGTLLDWVAAGLYGFETRPALPSGHNQNIGPFNTYTLNGLAFNAQKVIGNQNYYITSDDVFKRIITWHFFKGDGKIFNITWLKRRIMRFLDGVNGTAPTIDNTYQISVTFGVGNQVNITLLGGVRNITGGAIFNRFQFNSFPFNKLKTQFITYAPLANAGTLQVAIDAGVLELPFQFTYVVNIV